MEKFAHDFAEIYNKAWANHGEGKQIEAKKVLKMFQTMKPILDENISWFIYENDKPKNGVRVRVSSDFDSRRARFLVSFFMSFPLRV